MTEIKIPLLDLRAQYAAIKQDVKNRIENVLDNQGFILGPEVSELERKIAEYVGARHAVGVASGTDALILSLRALGVGPGDEVITPTFTFYSTASSVVLVGARPVFVDVDPDTCLIDTDKVKEAVNERTRAVVPVHLFGQCADVAGIRSVLGPFSPAILEDACQAIGAGLGGGRAGSMGDAAAISFYPSKNLGGYGDGGMVTTNRDDVADSIRLLRVHGARESYHHSHIGYNSRLDSIQAAVLLAKLPLLSEWASKRRERADYYDRAFQGTSVKPLARVGGDHVFNNYVVRVEKRDELMKYLAGKGIGSAVYYPVPLHRLGCFKPYLNEADSFPASERACLECLAIPVYPEMTSDMVKEVADKILEFYGL